MKLNFCFKISGLMLFTGLLVFGVADLAQAKEIVASDTFNVFSDVQYDKDELQMSYFLKNKQVLHGYPDGSLKLKQNINRAEFTKVILEAKEGLAIYYDENHVFPDVPKDAWFAPYVSTAKREGIVQGYPDGLFHPEREINYAESMTVLTKTFEVKEGDFEAKNYSGIKRSEGLWYQPFMKTAASRNLLAEQVLWDLQPDKSITRKDAFDSIYRTLIVEDFPGDYYKMPIIDFSLTDNFLFNHPKEDFKVPVVYLNVGDKVNVDIYKLDLKTFLKGIDYLRYYHYDGVRLVSSDLIEEMEFVESKELSIEQLAEDGVLPEGHKKGYVPLGFDEPGLYFFVLQNDYILPQHVFADISRNMILSKVGENKNLLFAGDYETSEPKADLEIQFYSGFDLKSKLSDDLEPKLSDVKLVQSVKTDVDGFYLGNNAASNYVAAIDGEDISILRSDVHVRETSKLENYASFVYTDRPVYRQGDQVYFKAILRKKTNSNYSLVAAGNLKVKITTYKNRGEEVVYEKSLGVSEFSTLSDSFELEETAATGNYSISIYDGENWVAGGDFQVEAYKKNEYELEINSDKSDYTVGDKVNVSVSGNYYFGQPVQNQKLNYKVYKKRAPYFWGTERAAYDEKLAFFDMDSDLLSSYGYGYGYREEILSGEGYLSENGEFNFSFSAPKDSDFDDYYSRNFLYTIEVFSVDSSNIPVTKTKNILVYPAGFDFELEEKTLFPKAGESYNLLIKTLDRSGNAYTGAKLKVFIKKRVLKDTPVYFDHWVEDYFKDKIYSNEYVEIAVFDNLIPDGSGRYLFEFVPDSSGDYQFEVLGTDLNGREVKTVYSSYVYGQEDKEQYRYTNNAFTLTFDKDLYYVGDTAKVIIESLLPVNELVWITHQEDVRTYELKDFSGSNLVEMYLPITEDMKNGFGVSADMLYRYKFYSQQKNIEVLPLDKKLEVTVEANKELYLPQETAEFTVTLRNYRGEPVTGDVSFALVDEAIFDVLKNDYEQKILQIFYGDRHYYYLSSYASEVSKNRSYYRIQPYPDYYEDGESVEEFDGRTMMDAAGNVAAPAVGMVMDAAKPTQEKAEMSGPSGEEERTDFLDTAYFLANAVTDGNGQAKIQVKLPDNLTTWVGTVYGHTVDTKVGEGSGEIVVSKDFIVSPYVPRFAMKGDLLTVRATLRNYRSDNETFGITVSGSGFTGNDLIQSAVIPKGQSETKSWNITVTDDSKLDLKFAMVASESSVNDTVNLTIPVRPFGTEIIKSDSGEDSGEITFSSESGNINNFTVGAT